MKDEMYIKDVYAILDDYDKGTITNELCAMNVFKRKSGSGINRKKMCYCGLKIKVKNR
jgi:hypothetical protein